MAETIVNKHTYRVEFDSEQNPVRLSRYNESTGMFVELTFQNDDCNATNETLIKLLSSIYIKRILNID